MKQFKKVMYSNSCRGQEGRKNEDKQGRKRERYKVRWKKRGKGKETDLNLE